MPDSPGRELHTGATYACNARFLATLDPHFTSIETPSLPGQNLGSWVETLLHCARELRPTSPVASCEAIGTADESRQRHLQRRRRPGRRHGQPVRQYPALWLRNGRRRRRGVALPSAPLPAPLSAACPLPACSWRSQRPRRETVVLLVAGLLGRQRRRGWVGAASVCGCQAACCWATCWPPGWLLAAGSDRHAVWLSSPPWQPGTETQCF